MVYGKWDEIEKMLKRIRKKMDSQYLFYVTRVRGQTGVYIRVSRGFYFVPEKLDALHKATPKFAAEY